MRFSAIYSRLTCFQSGRHSSGSCVTPMEMCNSTKDAVLRRLVTLLQTAQRMPPHGTVPQLQP